MLLLESLGVECFFGGRLYVGEPHIVGFPLLHTSLLHLALHPLGERLHLLLYLFLLCEQVKDLHLHSLVAVGQSVDARERVDELPSFHLGGEERVDNRIVNAVNVGNLGFFPTEPDSKQTDNLTAGVLPFE